jgi:hypothetical protein
MSSNTSSYNLYPPSATSGSNDLDLFYDNAGGLYVVSTAQTNQYDGIVLAASGGDFVNIDQPPVGGPEKRFLVGATGGAITMGQFGIVIDSKSFMEFVAINGQWWPSNAMAAVQVGSQSQRIALNQSTGQLEQQGGYAAQFGNLADIPSGVWNPSAGQVMGTSGFTMNQSSGPLVVNLPLISANKSQNLTFLQQGTEDVTIQPNGYILKAGQSVTLFWSPLVLAWFAPPNTPIIPPPYVPPGFAPASFFYSGFFTTLPLSFFDYTGTFIQPGSNGALLVIDPPPALSEGKEFVIANKNPDGNSATLQIGGINHYVAVNEFLSLLSDGTQWQLQRVQYANELRSLSGVPRLRHDATSFVQDGGHQAKAKTITIGASTSIVIDANDLTSFQTFVLNGAAAPFDVTFGGASLYLDYAATLNIINTSGQLATIIPNGFGPPFAGHILATGRSIQGIRHGGVVAFPKHHLIFTGAADFAGGLGSPQPGLVPSPNAARNANRHDYLRGDGRWGRHIIDDQFIGTLRPEWATVHLNTGSGTQLASAEVLLGDVGVFSLATSTNAAGRAAIHIPGTPFNISAHDYTLYTKFRLDTLSSANPTFSQQIGFMTISSTLAAMIDAVGLAYQPSTIPVYAGITSANWIAFIRNNNATTTHTQAIATSTVVAASTWYELEIRVTTNGTRIEFWLSVGGGSWNNIATINTGAGLPFLNRPIGAGARIEKTAGATNSALLLGHFTITAS